MMRGAGPSAGEQALSGVPGGAGRVAQGMGAEWMMASGDNNSV